MTMPLELIGITILWTFLYGYIIVASIDFGAGFFNFSTIVTGQKHIIQPIVQRYLSPVWEVTNVFLIFFIVGLVGFFPKSAYYFGTALLVPGSIAVCLIAVRGAYYAFGSYGVGWAKNSVLFVFLYGVSGLLIPASLSIVLTISEGGYIEQRGDTLIFLTRALFFSPYAWSVVLLSVVSVLYISAMFLTYYAHKAGDDKAYALMRRYALLWSGPTIGASVFVFFAISSHNALHFERLVDYSWLFVCSFAAFLVAVGIVWRKKPSSRALGWSFIAVMIQYACAFYGYGAAHLPYILYPYVTMTDTFTSPQMAWALIVAFLAGLLLLVPSLALLMRLFLFDAAYVRGRATSAHDREDKM
jgi:cytochrome d ubiquinol oxidase subunit II